MKATNVVTGLAIVFISLTAFLTVALFEHQAAQAAEAWQKEFDAVCSRTSDAMDLSKDELKNLIERCDKLKPTLQKLDETQRKVYLKRLEACRDLFTFMLESKEKN